MPALLKRAHQDLLSLTSAPAGVTLITNARGWWLWWHRHTSCLSAAIRCNLSTTGSAWTETSDRGQHTNGILRVSPGLNIQPALMAVQPRTRAWQPLGASWSLWHSNSGWRFHLQTVTLSFPGHVMRKQDSLFSAGQVLTLLTWNCRRGSSRFMAAGKSASLLSTPMLLERGQVSVSFYLHFVQSTDLTAQRVFTAYF